MIALMVGRAALPVLGIVGIALAVSAAVYGAVIVGGVGFLVSWMRSRWFRR